MANSLAHIIPGISLGMGKTVFERNKITPHNYEDCFIIFAPHVL